MPKMLDVVRLKDGRTGTVVEVFEDAYMVEVTDAKGKTIAAPIVKPEDIEAITYVA